MPGLYSVSQIRQLEHMLKQQGLSAMDLVCRAADAAFELIKTSWPDARNVVVFIGKGGNAADGLVLAERLHEAGFSVQVIQVIPSCDLSDVATEALQHAVAAGVVITEFFPEATHNQADLLVDALLGIGLKDTLSDPISAAVATINTADVPVLSLDVPTGLCANTGQIFTRSVQAHTTITFIAPKMGLCTGKSVACCGHLVTADLGLPADSLRSMSPAVDILTDEVFEGCLPKRCRGAHKGDFGHVLVIGGDYGMGGAIRLAAEAALRVGAGIVSVATRPEHVNIVSGGRPELMCHQVQQASDLDRLLTRATVIVLGPGLGQSDWARAIFEHVLDAPQPKVLDADALNLLSQMPEQSDNWILTPHPGEACRLLDVPCSDVQDNRYAAVESLQDRYGGVAVLKGVGTLICSPEGETVLCPAGNPGMASGGMGDILSGIIGGLLAQKLSLLQAASVGVLAHARAADEAVAQGGGERGLLATDLLAHIRNLVNPDA